LRKAKTDLSNKVVKTADVPDLGISLTILLLSQIGRCEGDADD